ncbi:hypothetical protein IC229_10945 [Spirosoma sp. BT702]|uniref:Uncharacterized protein n=1 Tax=Spirosoma profusum TaxID=2771354 RepID=A0A926XVK8_9BACT|nr:hypothetical protein [Spirosoma profusum]MBD2701154.1 hypothetical protein [Spirosoma profusum]
MEFDELQKIWDSQTKEPLWVINEEALNRHILAQKSQVHHITNKSELVLTYVYIVAGFSLFGVNIVNNSANLFMYLLAGWTLATGLYSLISRIQRLKREHEFIDRSMLGELKHALSIATYQVRLSRLMRWNMLPIITFCLIGVWESGKSVWQVLGLLLLFGAAYFVSGWEHSIYKGKKRELEKLQKKLQEEVVTQ